MDLEKVPYADDTAVVTASTTVATGVLRVIELSAVHYGMCLNSMHCDEMVSASRAARYASKTSQACHSRKRQSIWVVTCAKSWPGIGGNSAGMP